VVHGSACIIYVEQKLHKSTDLGLENLILAVVLPKIDVVVACEARENTIGVGVSIDQQIFTIQT
jgi:hypothetical protein